MAISTYKLTNSSTTIALNSATAVVLALLLLVALPPVAVVLVWYPVPGQVPVAVVWYSQGEKIVLKIKKENLEKGGERDQAPG